MSARINLAGKIFGRLTVVRYSRTLHRGAGWECLCRCGNTTLVRSTSLTTGNTKSCGHCNDAKKYPLEYKSYVAMLHRCYCNTANAYDRYGGRGISVSSSWRLDFLNFLADMGPRPSKDHSLDRIDNEGDYCKENCRWTTAFIQNNNRRSRLLKNDMMAAEEEEAFENGN